MNAVNKFGQNLDENNVRYAEGGIIIGPGRLHKKMLGKQKLMKDSDRLL